MNFSQTDYRKFHSTLHHALRAPRRRQVIQILGDQPAQPRTTRKLARKITSVEEDIPCEQASGEPYRNVYNALSQTHLPMLADAGLIIYESERQLVRPGPHFADGLLLLTLTNAALETLLQMQMAEIDEVSTLDAMTD